MERITTWITYLGIYFFAIATAIRIVSKLSGDPYQRMVVGILALFFLLLVLEPWLFHRSNIYTHIYLTLQTGIVIALAILPPHNDFFASLFFSLSLQAMYVLPSQIGFRWVGIFTITMAVFMLQIFEIAGIPLILIYAAAYIFMGSYAAYIRQAENDNKESRKILDELQSAYQQLQINSDQAEELAVVEERNRLARNLHDSVSQTVFSMTLTAEAACILLDRNPTNVETQLDKLQDLAKSALYEMRSLIFELRPTAVAKQGLIPALKQHIIALKGQHDLSISLQVSGEPHLTDLQAQRLFRVIQEALNNVIKHARVKEASIILKFKDNNVFLQIRDHGRGFVLEDVPLQKTHMGLAFMQERTESMAGTMKIDSRPGEGTSITVEFTSLRGDELDD